MITDKQGAQYAPQAYTEPEQIVVLKRARLPLMNYGEMKTLAAQKHLQGLKITTGEGTGNTLDEANQHHAQSKAPSRDCQA